MAGMVSHCINLLREGVHTQNYTTSLALQLLLPPTTEVEEEQLKRLQAKEVEESYKYS
jgi:hypothetical protein